jgi:hypothetical protein
MKFKIKDVVQLCPDCNREMSINDCDLHKDSHKSNHCYYCHLLKDHMKVWESTPDTKKK